jgi:hypothetical protein
MIEESAVFHSNASLLVNILGSILESLLFGLPYLGVWFWAIRRSRETGKAPSVWHRCIPKAMFALILMAFIWPLAHLANAAFSSPSSALIFGIVDASLSLVRSIAYGVCWYIVLKAAFVGLGTHHADGNASDANPDLAEHAS